MNAYNQSCYSPCIEVSVQSTLLTRHLLPQSISKHQDAWIAYNLSTSEIKGCAELAVKSGLKRVVFAVFLDESERYIMRHMT